MCVYKMHTIALCLEFEEKKNKIIFYSFYDGKLLRIPQDPDPGLGQAGEFTLSNPITQRRHLPTEKINALPTGT